MIASPPTALHWVTTIRKAKPRKILQALLFDGTSLRVRALCARCLQCKVLKTLSAYPILRQFSSFPLYRFTFSCQSISSQTMSPGSKVKQVHTTLAFKSFPFTPDEWWFTFQVPGHFDEVPLLAFKKLHEGQEYELYTGVPRQPVLVSPNLVFTFVPH